MLACTKFFRETGILNRLLTVAPGTSGIASQWFNQVLTEESRGGHNLQEDVEDHCNINLTPSFVCRRKTSYAKGFHFYLFWASVTRTLLKGFLPQALCFVLLSSIRSLMWLRLPFGCVAPITALTHPALLVVSSALRSCRFALLSNFLVFPLLWIYRRFPDLADKCLLLEHVCPPVIAKATRKKWTRLFS